MSIGNFMYSVPCLGTKSKRKEIKVIIYDVSGKGSISCSPIHRLIYNTIFQCVKGAWRPIPMKCTCFYYMLVKRQIMRRKFGTIK